MIINFLVCPLNAVDMEMRGVFGSKISYWIFMSPVD
jgi:hypothetical protein